MMSFEQKRRQQFLSASSHKAARAFYREDFEYFTKHPYGTGESQEHKESLGRRAAANSRFHLLLLDYTAGEPLDVLRSDLGDVIAAFERYAQSLWSLTKSRDEPVFDFALIDDYCALIQLVGLCVLLHRRDLLPRIAAMQDGEAGANGGADTLYEELMAYTLGADTRYETDWLCWKRPFESLFHALTETTPAKQLKELDLFLKHWYKDLAGIGWHDSHKANEAGEQAGYFGYWSFEAGAAALLLGIEDDSGLDKYLYYPKDMVAWARSHTALSDPSASKGPGLRATAGELCPREGFWTTAARPNARQKFSAGVPMPDLGGDYGATIWQWDERQD
jgi:hypothetical protein